jgi:hypothetical protein
MEPENESKSVQNILDIEEVEVVVKDMETAGDTLVNRNMEIQDDYEFCRKTLYNLVEVGAKALDEIVSLANQTDSPRAYEVMALLIKNLSETNEKILKLQQDTHQIEKETGVVDNPQSVTNNAIFVGTTHELQKLLKQHGNKDDGAEK